MLRTLSLALSLLTLVSSAVHAVAQRTFVSTAGNDGNTVSNCSLAAPCRSFGFAIGVTNPNGELIVLDSGGYGPVTITQGVTIEAPAGVYAGITVMSSGTGVLINAPAATVRLRGLTINALGGSIGIDILAAANVEIVRTRVVGMATQGISGTAAGGRVVIADTVVTDTVGTSSAVSLSNAASVDIERLRVTRSNGVGLALSDVDVASVRDSSVIDSNLTLFANAVQVNSSSGTTSQVSFDRVIVSGATANCIIGIASGAGSVQMLGVARSLVTHCSTNNASNSGIRSAADTSGIAIVVINDSVIRGSQGRGVDASGTGSTLSVSGSTIVDNVGFGLNNGGSVLYSRGDNTVRGNNGQETTLQTSGTITTLLPM